MFFIGSKFQDICFSFLKAKKIFYIFFQIITCQKIRSPLPDYPGTTLNEDKLIGTFTSKRLNRNEVCVRPRPTQG
jgi:hypothetical protein